MFPALPRKPQLETWHNRNIVLHNSLSTVSCLWENNLSIALRACEKQMQKLGFMCSLSLSLDRDRVLTIQLTILPQSKKVAVPYTTIPALM